MKVGYIVSRYPAMSHTFILREIEGLRSLGVDVQPFSVRPSFEDWPLSPIDREHLAQTKTLLPITGAKVRGLLSFFARHPRAITKTLQHAVRTAPSGIKAKVWAVCYVLEAVLLYQHAEKQGIRHLHAHFANNGCDVARLTAKLGNFIGAGSDRKDRWTWSFTMHGSTEFFSIEKFNLAVKAREADAISCITEFCRSQVMAVVDESHWEKMKVVRLGLDLSGYATRSFEDESNGPLKIITVGRLNERKGISLLLDTVAMLGDSVELRIIGDGPDRAKFEQRARSLGIEARVTFVGPVGQDRIAEHYLWADVFCLSSLAEGLPAVIMEAMAHGIPVVTSRLGGIPELIEDGVSGLLVAPGNKQQLHGALLSLLTEPALRTKLAAAGLENVRQYHDIHVSGQQMSEFFATVRNF